MARFKDLSIDLILCQFFEQASNRNLGSRPIIKVLKVFESVNHFINLKTKL